MRHVTPSRRRWTGGAILAVALATAAAAPSAAGASAVPVLGSASLHPHDSGFGTAHPRKIDNGGDPSGIAFDLSWKHWGASEATATGKTYVFKPSGGYYAKPGRIELEALALGHCSSKGPLAYIRLHARVAAPGHKRFGSWFNWGGGSGDIC